MAVASVVIALMPLVLLVVPSSRHVGHMSGCQAAYLLREDFVAIILRCGVWGPKVGQRRGIANLLFDLR